MPPSCSTWLLPALRARLGDTKHVQLSGIIGTQCASNYDLSKQRLRPVQSVVGSLFSGPFYFVAYLPIELVSRSQLDSGVFLSRPTCHFSFALSARTTSSLFYMLLYSKKSHMAGRMSYWYLNKITKIKVACFSVLCSHYRCFLPSLFV